MVPVLEEEKKKCRYNIYFLQTRFQKSWDTVQIVNKKGMQKFTNLINLYFIHNRI